jgi:hypothetical protein
MANYQHGNLPEETLESGDPEYRLQPISEKNLSQYRQIERLAREIGEDFDPDTYRSQMQQLDDYSRQLPEDLRSAIREGFSREEFESRMADKYPDIFDWSGLEEYRGAFDRKSLLFRAGEIAALVAAPFIFYHTVKPLVSHAAVLDGQLCLEWCPNSPDNNIDHYKVFYIEEYLINDYPDIYDPNQKGSIENWNYEDVPAGQTTINLTGLTPGRIYHVRAKAVDIDGAESDYSANEPIGVDAILGNVDRESTGSQNRVDFYDIIKFRNSGVMGSRYGDANFNPWYDFDGDYDVDFNDYRTLLSNFSIVQPNEMGTSYEDDSLIVESGSCTAY